MNGDFKMGDKALYVGHPYRVHTKERMGQVCEIMTTPDKNGFVLVAFHDRNDFHTYTYNLKPAKDHYIKKFKEAYAGL